MRRYKPYRKACHRTREEQAKIDEETAKRKARIAERYNTELQYYGEIPLRLIVREDYGCYKAKRFRINETSQNIWIPNCYLEDDGTLKKANIDFIFRKAVNQLNKAGLTQAIIGIKRKYNPATTSVK